MERIYGAMSRAMVVMGPSKPVFEDHLDKGDVDLILSCNGRNATSMRALVSRPIDL